MLFSDGVQQLGGAPPKGRVDDRQQLLHGGHVFFQVDHGDLHREKHAVTLRAPVGIEAPPDGAHQVIAVPDIHSGGEEGKDAAGAVVAVKLGDVGLQPAGDLPLHLVHERGAHGGAVIAQAAGLHGDHHAPALG